MLKPLNKSAVEDLIFKQGKRVAIGVYLDSTAEFKSGVSGRTGKPYTIKNITTLVKFGDDEATTVTREVESEAQILEYRNSPKPFTIGERVVVLFTECGRDQAFKPTMRATEIHSFAEK